jgi:hypothetical protein
MEMSQENPLYSYLKQRKMLFYFSFTKSQINRQNRSCLQVLGSVGGGVGCGERMQEDEYSTNTVYICM